MYYSGLSQLPCGRHININYMLEVSELIVIGLAKDNSSRCDCRLIKEISIVLAFKKTKTTCFMDLKIYISFELSYALMSLIFVN